MGLDRIEAAAAPHHLGVFGAFTPDADDLAPDGTGTLVLLGPREPGFWPHFTQSAEYRDGAPHPMDRWSSRVIGALADALGAQALFPFGGPPYQPFIRWAMRSGRAWQSPAGPLVHDTAGMMVSYRGALALPDRIDLGPPPPKPCDTCAETPCLTACPVGALSAVAGYDVAACHDHLDTKPPCLSRGCAARRACPVSQTYARRPEQSAFHMQSFHP